MSLKVIVFDDENRARLRAEFPTQDDAFVFVDALPDQIQTDGEPFRCKRITVRPSTLDDGPTEDWNEQIVSANGAVL